MFWKRLESEFVLDKGDALRESMLQKYKYK